MGGEVASGEARKRRERDAYYRRKYGISIVAYEALSAKTSGGCWICGRQPTGRALHVDHDHKTLRVRGLLCWSCNTALRVLHDDAVTAYQAAGYLEDGGRKAALTIEGALIP